MGKPVDQPRTEAARLGSYEIVRKLAKGGMAELFLARTIGPEGFEKLVVLKKILPTHAANPKFVRLFLDEAKLVATLDHPHIAHVYDMGKVDGDYFFTMEYVHGQDVRATLRRTSRLARKFPIDHAVQIARNIAAALHYAHERRRPDGALLDVVHRDVSPSNILISYDGAVKLVDFGVAKAATSTVKTRTGTLKGKISYMSPEQAKGSPIDRRSDIFSLGIVLWEMVTTQRLFKSDNDLATIQMIINSKAQPPSQVNPLCPPELERIVMRALEVNAADRYQTAELMQLDLEELAREEKLKQSTVALRGYMHELFSAEIHAWTVAQAAGQTLTDHVASSNEMTTPVSESELEYPDEDDEDDEDPDSEQATAMATNQLTNQVASPHNPVVAGTLRIEPSGPNVIVREQTPPPGPLSAPFPVAAREWHAPLPTSTGVDLGEKRRKSVLIAGSVVFGAIVLIAIAFGADPAPEDASAPAAPEETIEMPAAPRASDPAPTPVEPAPQPAHQQAAHGSAATTTADPPIKPPTPTRPPVATPTRPPATGPKVPPPPINRPKPDRPKPRPKYDPNSALPPP